MTTSLSGPGRPAPSMTTFFTILILVSPAVSDPEAIHVASGGLSELPSIGPLSTKTVLGFLDFVTTVSDTVIKFTSQGGPGNTPAFNPVQSSAFLGSDFNSNNQENPSSFIEVKSNQHETAKSNEIKPSPVKETSINEGVTHLPNGVVEIDGAVDNTVYDKFSAESELTADESYTIEDATPTDISDYYYNDSEDNTENSEETEVTTKKNISSLRSRSRPNFRKSASQAYKERLRKRVEKEKAKLQLAELASKKSYRSKKVSSPAKK